MPLYAIDGIAPELPASGNFWIAPTAVLIGKVIVKEGASIWFGAVLRGDNEPIVVGEGSNIQENSVLHTDPGCPLTIGSDVTVGHNVILHGCIIGDHSLIGMGATVLNRAIIPSHCLVGAGALVTEGKTFPERSLIVGSPAKAVRSLDDAAVEGLAKSALNYQRNALRYAQGLVRVD
ncbi:gamma carbonic anhydrase family protein [Xanthobacter agilis]|jgi:carbonic anhydrase/acetyltransferase-like protein (isoleucine patch superfamily)|uniref:Carbonic anhydrase/acetyltransferase-like protein (Isoleucine patch superfamily) n=1 Tax=Xanthobacter agilis TaxID=47492 RepID=A0ABU0LAT2_XANAG|nr:gamma carbonic anhydrase family protein [Xanthobacter agilis]MDQ0504243.1 carbonic anhydrase/acetyltransferase-like protein (isoleucine patch superfamily) [Xanthobacter agilis]